MFARIVWFDPLQPKEVRKLTIKAIVQKVIPKGRHGPFAVATSEKIEGSVTFSLEPTVWTGDEWPEEGSVVLLDKLRQKRAGWRAKSGRFFELSDEQTERRNKMTEQYRKIAADEIEAAAEHDPTRALLMMMSNSTLEDAEQRASGAKAHEPKFHEAGWYIAVETSQGYIGLWSCWLENQFYLGYPKSFTDRSAIEKLIVETLGVKYAEPVLQVSGTAVSEGYEGEYKDPDKPLETNSAGQIVAYKTYGPRLWAKFYGPRIEGKLGRFWVDHSDFDSYGHHFDVIRDGRFGAIETVSMGHDHSMSIASAQFNFTNQYAPDGPTTDKEVVQSYRTPFLRLMCEIAKLMGGANAVHINYGFAIVPEQLTTLGYDNIDWLKGTPGSRQGWGEEIVRAEKDGEILVLKSGNSMVPWSAIRRVTPETELTAEHLLELLTF